MRNTALEHPLVRGYLRQLTEALAPLPPQRAAELRDQIAGHLEEELTPGATDAEVADAIRRMGTPADLAREAGARRTLWPVLRRRSRRFWVISASTTTVVAAAAAVLISLLVSVENATPLTFTGLFGWWYPQDWTHAVSTTADSANQSTVPVRWHQRQGFFVQINNYSRYTQTVLGYAPYSGQSPAGDPAQLALSADPSAGMNPGDPHPHRYTLPVSIPPGQSRFLRVLWYARDCVGDGQTSSIDQVKLRVRVGWITRTETISLAAQAWAVQGTAQSSCGG